MPVQSYLSLDKFWCGSMTKKGGNTMANKHVKSVSFNLDNKEEQLAWKYVSKKNFSGYVKKLIIEDMKRKAAEKNQSKPFIPSK